MQPEFLQKEKETFLVFALIYAQIPSHCRRFISVTVTKYTEDKIGKNPTTNQVLTFNLMNFKWVCLLGFAFVSSFSERSKHNTEGKIYIRKKCTSWFHLAFPKNHYFLDFGSQLFQIIITAQEKLCIHSPTKS